MSNIKQIKIDGVSYSIDLQRAIDLGLVKKRDPIQKFSVGDLFRYPDPVAATVVVVETAYRSNRYSIMGHCGLKHYGDFFPVGSKTYNEMIQWLNERELIFVKNMNEDFANLLKKEINKA